MHKLRGSQLRAETQSNTLTQIKNSIAFSRRSLHLCAPRSSILPTTPHNSEVNPCHLILIQYIYTFFSIFLPSAVFSPQSPNYFPNRRIFPGIAELFSQSQNFSGHRGIIFPVAEFSWSSPNYFPSRRIFLVIAELFPASQNFPGLRRIFPGIAEFSWASPNISRHRRFISGSAEFYMALPNNFRLRKIFPGIAEFFTASRHFLWKRRFFRVPEKNFSAWAKFLKAKNQTKRKFSRFPLPG